MLVTLKQVLSGTVKQNTAGLQTGVPEAVVIVLIICCLVSIRPDCDSVIQICVTTALKPVSLTYSVLCELT